MSSICGAPRKYCLLATSLTNCCGWYSANMNGPVPMGLFAKFSPISSAAFLQTMLPPLTLATQPRNPATGFFNVIFSDDLSSTSTLSMAEKPLEYEDVALLLARLIEYAASSAVNSP